MTVTLCLSRSLLLLNRRPRAHSSGLKDPCGLMWLSLPHFVYNSVRSSTQLPLVRRTQLNYIIVQRPLDLWNRMFNRHQAEITVMQFGGHSLPVHHSVVYHGKNLGCPRGVMVKAMHCGIVVREFVLQSRYYVHFRTNTLGKGMNPLILPPAMGK